MTQTMADRWNVTLQLGSTLRPSFGQIVSIFVGNQHLEVAISKSTDEISINFAFVKFIALAVELLAGFEVEC